MVFGERIHSSPYKVNKHYSHFTFWFYNPFSLFSLTIKIIKAVLLLVRRSTTPQRMILSTSSMFSWREYHWIISIIGLLVSIIVNALDKKKFLYVYFKTDNMPVTWCYRGEPGQQYCSTGFPMGCYVTKEGKAKDACVMNVRWNITVKTTFSNSILFCSLLTANLTHSMFSTTWRLQSLITVAKMRFGVEIWEMT